MTGMHDKKIKYSERERAGVSVCVCQSARKHKYSTMTPEKCVCLGMMCVLCCVVLGFMRDD